MTTYQSLLAQKAALEKQTAELEKQLNEARKADRAGVISQIKQLMADHGLTPDDLGGKAGKEKKTSANAGKTVAPKYKDNQGNTWTGRGLQPKWIKALIASGKTLDDLKI